MNEPPEQTQSRRRRRAVGPPDGTPAGPEPRGEPAPDTGDDERDLERLLAERPPHHDQER